MLSVLVDPGAEATRDASRRTMREWVTIILSAVGAVSILLTATLSISNKFALDDYRIQQLEARYNDVNTRFVKHQDDTRLQFVDLGKSLGTISNDMAKVSASLGTLLSVTGGKVK